MTTPLIRFCSLGLRDALQTSLAITVRRIEQARYLKRHYCMFDLYAPSFLFFPFSFLPSLPLPLSSPSLPRSPRPSWRAFLLPGLLFPLASAALAPYVLFSRLLA